MEILFSICTLIIVIFILIFVSESFGEPLLMQMPVWKNLFWATDIEQQWDKQVKLEVLIILKGKGRHSPTMNQDFTSLINKTRPINSLTLSQFVFSFSLDIDSFISANVLLPAQQKFE